MAIVLNQAFFMSMVQVDSNWDGSGAQGEIIYSSLSRKKIIDEIFSKITEEYMP